MKKIIILFIALLIASGAISQNIKPIAQKISEATLRNESFVKTELFGITGSTLKQSSRMKSIVKDATVLQFSNVDAQAVASSKPAFLNFVIPVSSQKVIELQLYRSNIFTPDFRVTTSSNNGQPVVYSDGVHYWGIIKGDNSSLAAISIFDNEVMGIIANATDGNLVLGKIENDVSGNHILYNDRNLNAIPGTNCFTENDNESYQPKDLQNANKVLSNCIRLFWEVNYDIYTGKGSVANAANYVTAVFNQSAIIYANDAIPVELAEVFVWNTTSPYTSTSTSGLLGQFQNYRNTINGDLGHLLGYAGGGGVAAGFSGFCASNLNSSQCYSGVQSSYNNVPTYSWTVMVVTHEQGHLMGSRHTHACVWNGNNTAIDGCGPAAGYGYEGSCSGASIPPTGGTIMSYCHLNAVGINFNNGFGTQPKNVILNNYNSASCLTSCVGTSCMPSANMSTASVLSTTATFNWAAVTGASSYNIQYRIIGSGTWLTGTSATATFNATGLTPGANYEWQVQTVCSGGNSIFTISTNFTSQPLTCSTPINLSTTNISSASATFNWTAVSGAISYNLRYRIVGSGTWTTGTSATTSFNASGLTPSLNYEWQIQTSCSGGATSAYSSSVNFTTSAPPCNAPQNINTTNIGSTTATFNWNAVSGAVSYNVQYRIVGSPLWTTQSASVVSYNATGLTPSSDYEWQVMTVCTGGQSTYGYISLFTTLCDVTAALITASGPTTFCTGGSVLLSATSGTGFSYQWQSGGINISGATAAAYSATTQGFYSVIITGISGCSKTSAPFAVSTGSAFMIMQPNGATGIDAFVASFSSNATTNYGTNQELNALVWTVGGSPSVQRGFIRFDLSTLPANATITQAILTLFNDPASSNGNPPGEHSSYTGSNAGWLQRVTATWDENLITWNNQPAVTAVNQVTIPQSLYSHQDYDLDVTSSIQDMVTNPASNFGFMFRMQTETAYRVLVFASSDNADPTNWPRLSIVYSYNPVVNAAGPTGFCIGGNVQLNTSLAPGFTYQWQLNTSNIAGATNTSYTATASGSYTVVVTNSCGSATSTPVTVTVHPLPTVSFTGLAASYNVIAPAATLTGSPSGGTFTGPGITGNVFSPSAAGTGGPYTIMYSYTDGNGCSNSSSQQTTVTNCTLPAKPGSITAVGGNTKVCPGDVKTYSIAAVAGATSYTWTPPAGGVVTNGQGTVSVTVSYTANFIATDSLKVAANNACGTGIYRALKITRNTPTKPGVITGQNNGVCNLSNVPYSIVNVAGITYNWSFSVTTASITNGQGTNAVTADFSSSYLTGTLAVTGNNACGTSDVRTLVVNAKPATPGAISGAATVCANQQGVPYSIAPVTGAVSYTWTGTPGSHISDGVVTSAGTVLTTSANSVTVNFGGTAGILKVKADNACASSSNKTLTIAFNCRVSENEYLPGVSIYPNPATGAFTIQFENKPALPVRIEITDVIGKVVESFETSEQQIVIDNSNFVSGIYYMTAKNKEGMEVKKISILK